MKNWRNRDWVWVTSILIGIIVIILTWRLNDNDNIVNIISMFASGASIILAVVAIVQSTIYNSSSNELNSKMTEKLSLLENNVELVKENILNSANKAIENAPIDENIKQEIKDNLSNSMEENRVYNNNLYGQVFEKLIYCRFKNIYGEIYEGNNYNEDIVIKKNNKEIIFEIKICINSSLASMVRIIKNFESIKDNSNRILLLISNNVHKRETWLNKRFIRILSPKELCYLSDYELKEKIKIEELS